MIRQKRRCSPIIAGNLALDKEKVMDCDSDLMTYDDSSFLTCSSGRGEDTSLPGQVDMDQLNMCMTKLKVDDTKPAPITPSNNRNQGSQAKPIIPGVINVKGYRKCQYWNSFNALRKPFVYFITRRRGFSCSFT